MESREVVKVVPSSPSAAERNPALIYCASLRGSGRSSMVSMLRRCAKSLGGSLKPSPGTSSAMSTCKQSSRRWRKRNTLRARHTLQAP